MVEPDSVKLLRECDAGVKMGIDSINQVLNYASDQKLKDSLISCREEHNRLNEDIQRELGRFHDDGKNPNPIAQGMSWIKTNVELVMNESDKTIANLITDGCNMGVKSLNQYLNQYEAAEEYAKDITKKLIKLEEKLRDEIRDYL